MGASWLGDESWKPEILSGAQKDLDELPDAVRDEALQLLADLLENPFPSDPDARISSPGLVPAGLTGSRNHGTLVA